MQLLHTFHVKYLDRGPDTHKYNTEVRIKSRYGLIEALLCYATYVASSKVGTYVWRRSERGHSCMMDGIMVSLILDLKEGGVVGWQLRLLAFVPLRDQWLRIAPIPTPQVPRSKSTPKNDTARTVVFVRSGHVWETCQKSFWPSTKKYIYYY